MISMPTTPAQTNAVQPAYELTEADKARQKQIADNWQAIEGDLTPPLQKMPNGTDPNVCPNRCGPIVDRGVDALFGKPLGIMIGETDPKAAQTFLEECWGENEARLPLLQDIAYNGAAAFRGFLRIVPNTQGTKFRLVVVDPSIVSVKWAPQDCETVLLYHLEYSEMEKKEGKNVQVFYCEEIARIDPDGNSLKSMPDDDDTWEIQHWTRIGDRGPWTPAGKPIAWKYNFAPLFSCKNLPKPNDFWGNADVNPNLIGMNNALNLSLSCANLVQLLYGQPIIAASGVSESSIDIKPGKIIGLPTDTSKIWAVAITSDLANSLAFAADVRSDMDEQSGIPAVVLGRQKDIVKGQVSGVTMELMFMPLTMKNEKKKCLYGKLIIDVSMALLALGKFSPDIKVSLKWQSFMPDDDLAAVQAAQGKQALGVSNQTLISEMGYNPEEEMDLNDAETEKAIAKVAALNPQPAPAQPGQPPVKPPSPFIGGGQP